MSKSRNNAFYKQQSVINQFDRINRTRKWEEKHGKQNLSITEKLINEANARKNSNQSKVEDKPRFSPNVYAVEWVKQNGSSLK